MKKRITALAMAFVMVLGTVALAAGTEKTISVSPMTMSINGQTVTPTKSDGTPAEVFAHDGATYVPLRYLSELLGITVEWDKNDSGTAKLVSDKLTVPSAPVSFTPGTYTGEGQGFGGAIKVSVTLSANRIERVEVTENSETPGVGSPAIEKLPAAIVEAQSTQVDGVSGATLASNGVIGAVNAALKSAGVDPAALKPNAADTVQRTSAEYSADIVVVGAGVAGMAAALTAAEEGAKVILLEKAAALGGDFARSGGNFVVVNTDAAASFGVDDNLKDTLAFWDLGTKRSLDQDSAYPDMKRVENMLLQTNDLINWMKGHGVVYYKATPVDAGATVAKVYAEGKGANVAATLTKELEAAGVNIMTETPATELIAENGKVVGVKAQSPTQDITVRAKAVMLCTGGFGANAEMLAELVPEFAGASFGGSPDITGDGIIMARAVGAKLYEKPWTMSSCSIDRDIGALEGASSFSRDTFDDWAMINDKGLRFCNENTGNSYAALANYIANEKCPTYYIVGSSDEEADVLAAGAAKGVVPYGNTIQELAKALNVDESNLKKTLDNYTKSASKGAADPFNKPKEQMTPYPAKGPYYAVRFNPSLIGTIGGVVTDEHGRVYDENDHVIEGLYAAGEMSNRSFYNQVYVGSASLSLYPIAARNAVAFIMGK